jgi:CxxC-x17-CxxC domain-containing protein
MEFRDKILQCIDCNQDFVFSAAEQMFFQEKQFRNEPKRCKQCKAKRVAAVGGNPRQVTRKVETQAVCSVCGKETTVPFRPTQGRPVLCRECFTQQRPKASSA